MWYIWDVVYGITRATFQTFQNKDQFSRYKDLYNKDKMNSEAILSWWQ